MRIFHKNVMAWVLEVLGGVDEQHVVRLLALLQHEDADWDARRVEQVRRQADHGIDVSVLEQFGADASNIAKYSMASLMTEAAMFTASGEAVQPSEVLF